MRPVLLALCSSANEVGNNQASAKEHDGAVEEDFQALVVAQMQAGDSDIPEKSEHGAANENYDTGEHLPVLSACIRADHSKDSSAHAQ
jgi:hypothetical protein